MNKKYILLICASFFILLFITGCQPNKYDNKYEYVIASYEDQSVIEELNKMGEKGCIVDSARRVTFEKEITLSESTYIREQTIKVDRTKYEFIFRCPKEV